MTDTLTHCDCGHAPTPHAARPPLRDLSTGYATAPGGRTLCFTCADDAQRAELLSGGRATAYLSSDHRTVTTWTGGVLGAVTRYTESAPRYGTYGTYRRCYVRVTDVHGQHWTGTGPVENGDYVSLRRTR